MKTNRFLSVAIFIALAFTSASWAQTKCAAEQRRYDDARTRYIMAKEREDEASRRKTDYSRNDDDYYRELGSEFNRASRNRFEKEETMNALKDVLWECQNPAEVKARKSKRKKKLRNGQKLKRRKQKL